MSKTSIAATSIINADAASYCGPPPAPDELFSAWNFDPLLIAGLLAFAGIGFLCVSRGSERVRLAAGLAALVIAFVSPLCAWSAALFSARAAHHVLLISIAAPLLTAMVRVTRLRLDISAIAFSALLWLWHVPALYAAALAHDSLYWMMELSLLISAAMVWRAAFTARDELGASLALLGVMMQMSLLGGLLTFASTPLYTPHFGTTLAWGLSPLEDQQLAGLIMWVPGALPFLIGALVPLRSLMTATKLSST